MGKLFQTIEKLEKRVQKVLTNQYNDPAIDAFEQVYIDALIRSIGEVTNRADVASLVEAALIESLRGLKDGLEESIQTQFALLVDEATEFYTTLGLTVPDLTEALTQTNEAKKLKKLFASNFGSMADDLYQATIDAFEQQIALNSLNKAALIESIKDALNAPVHFARTNARLVVSGYNRLYRDVLAKEVGLDYALYFGDKRENTRSFCTRCIGKVFSRKEIELMQNGQGLDVIHYAGGYNCIHSWLWVDPEWDAELSDAIYNKPLGALEDGSLNLVVPEA